MDNSTDYTIEELFAELKADESWEPDKAARERAANNLYFVAIAL